MLKQSPAKHSPANKQERVGTKSNSVDKKATKDETMYVKGVLAPVLLQEESTTDSTIYIDGVLAPQDEDEEQDKE